MPGSPEESEQSPPEQAQDSEESSKRMVRRAFFLEGVLNILKPVADIIESRLDHIRNTIEESQRAAMVGSEQAPAYRGEGDTLMEPESSRILRPPGALEEDLFLDRCASSGQCVAACPVQAIQVLQSEDPRLNETPYIDPQVQACVVCEELACMKVCPTGALQLVPRNLINVGVAEVRQDTCLRSDGEDCQICVEKCPIGVEALWIPHDGASVEVKTDGCVGCGVCEMYCPTEPRAIVVRPA